MIIWKQVRRLFILLLGCLLLTGCSGQAGPEQVLWVVTEKSSADGMNLQAEDVAQQIEAEYPGWTVQLEILPTESDERELRLRRLRPEIMSGNGPDVYLLPTGKEIPNYKGDARETISIEPLFSDVWQAMYSGVFADISQLYDNDDDLGKDALNQDVMDGVLLDGKRYVLPIRYDIPVLYTCPDLCRQYGLNEDVFEADILTVIDALFSAGKEAGIGLQLPEELEAFGQLMDYTKGNVTITTEEIQQYLSLYQQREVLFQEKTQTAMGEWEYQRRTFWLIPGHDISDILTDDAFRNTISYPNIYPKIEDFDHEWLNSLTMYTAQDVHWLNYALPVYTGWLSGILDTLGVTVLTQQSVEVYPLQTVDGAVQAKITYFGAVGSSSQHPEIGYAFLQKILSEDFQWELTRPRVNKEGAWWTWEKETQGQCLLECSLPVRTKGCVPGLWDNLQYRAKRSYFSNIASTVRRCTLVQQTFLTNEDVPELFWSIDQVYFPVNLPEGQEFSTYIEQIQENTTMLTETDLANFAQEIYQNLWWHLAEG